MKKAALVIYLIFSAWVSFAQKFNQQFTQVGGSPIIVNMSDLAFVYPRSPSGSVLVFGPALKTVNITESVNTAISLSCGVLAGFTEVRSDYGVPSTRAVAVSIQHVSEVVSVSNTRTLIKLQAPSMNIVVQASFSTVSSKISKCFSIATSSLEAGDGIEFSADTVNASLGTFIDSTEIAQMGAAVGQVLKWNGTGWVPANDSGGAGAGHTIAGDGSSVVQMDTLNFVSTSTVLTAVADDATKTNVSLEVDTSLIATVNDVAAIAASAGDLTAASNKATITGGTGAVFGAGATVDVNQYNLLLDSIGGSLSLSKVAQGGATTNQGIRWNGSTWTPATMALGSGGTDQVAYWTSSSNLSSSYRMKFDPVGGVGGYHLRIVPSNSLTQAAISIDSIGNNGVGLRINGYAGVDQTALSATSNLTTGTQDLSMRLYNRSTNSDAFSYLDLWGDGAGGGARFLTGSTPYWVGATNGVFAINSVSGWNNGTAGFNMNSSNNIGLGAVANVTNKLYVSGSTRFDLGSDATGDVFYRNSAGSFTRLGIGSSGTVLKVSGGLPSWGTDNDAQTIDTFSVAAGIVSLSLSNDAQPAKTIDLSAYANPATGNLTAASNRVTVSGGTGAVIGAGASVNVNQYNMLLDSIGGSLSPSKIAQGGAASNDGLVWNGSAWAPAAIPSGSGTANQVALWSGTNSLTGSSTLTYETNTLSLFPTANDDILFIDGAGANDFSIKMITDTFNGATPAWKVGANNLNGRVYLTGYELYMQAPMRQVFGTGIEMKGSTGSVFFHPNGDYYTGTVTGDNQTQNRNMHEYFVSGGSAYGNPMVFQQVYAANDSTGNSFEFLSRNTAVGGITIPDSTLMRIGSWDHGTALEIKQGGKIGVGTRTPAYTFDINSTDGLRVPIGTTAQRPGSTPAGVVRYNSTTSHLEYADGSAWNRVENGIYGGSDSIPDNTRSKVSSNGDWNVVYNDDTPALSIDDAIGQAYLGSKDGNYTAFAVNGSSGLTGPSSTGVTCASGVVTVATTSEMDVTGNLKLTTAGNKLIVTTGSNASIGTATLSGGTVTVNTTAVTTSSIIFVVHNTPAGVQGILSAPSASIVNGTSFVINSSNAADTGTVNWWIIN